MAGTTGRALAIQTRLLRAGFGVACLVASVACRAPAPVIAPQCPANPIPAGSEAMVDALRTAVFPALHLQAGMHVADIGVGGGRWTFALAMAIGENGLVYGTDIDAATLQRLKDAPHLPPEAAKIEPRLVHTAFETGLDDLPEASLDRILMVDSLCFDQTVDRTAAAKYLHGFLRVLKHGGQFVHHMDCRCATTLADVEQLFTAAGFSGKPTRIPVPCSAVPTTTCGTGANEERARYVGVFTRP